MRAARFPPARAALCIWTMLLNRAVEKAREIIEEKSPDLPDKDKVARQVGIGAVVFFDLFNNRIKDIDFSLGSRAEL